MSEEILKALTQLFAIITKQDGGVTENERQFVINFFQQELDQDTVKEYLALYDDFSGYNKLGKGDDEKNKLTSVKDSVKTLGICKKINKTLTQKQKVVVLTKLLELIGSDKNFTPQRIEIINTVSTVFNIDQEEYKLVETFIIAEKVDTLNFKDILLVNSLDTKSAENQKHAHAHIEGQLIFMRIKSVDMYFSKYLGDQSNMLNGFIMQPNKVYLFSHGSTIKTQGGDALYYSDLVAHFNEELKTTKLSFNANIEEFKFPNGAIGLRNVVISEGPGKLIGIMGASGAGKTTLLLTLAGLEKPSKGGIKINGFNIHEEKENIEGVIGFVSQDDLLIEELTVYQNLYYNAKLCFSNFTEKELHERVMSTLVNLGLDQRKDLTVGSVLDKKISGGQRKRLNIALELIREPAILFLDEPTSGLSSRDSENVIDLLKELSLKGKLIFVVIHQPSSDIYKMFDKMIIMDTGGYPAYYGSPVEAVTYFKKATHQVDSNRGQCETCGNVNPEQIFNIIESKVVDEYGQPTTKRKVTPPQWFEMYQKRFNINLVADVKEAPPSTLRIPSRLKQTVIFTMRDMLAKLSNKQYLLINLLEAPLLAIILAFIIKYKSAPGGREYAFRFNDNFPAFLLMAIIVALFMGLTVSAEEIIRDRKILKRESFLNLSWNSYLISKLNILFLLSAIQTFTFVVIGNLILEIHGMTLAMWLVLFTTSCFANVLGLNISSAFNSAVTVYVMIPLLLIPQMILSGLLFSFDKLNNLISTKGKVPIVADLMASRWAYEAIAVYQFKNNDYEEPFYNYEREEAKADFKAAFLADELKKRNQFVLENFESKKDSVKNLVEINLTILRDNLRDEPYRPGFEKINLDEDLSQMKYTKVRGMMLDTYFEDYRKHYQKIYNENVNLIEKKMAFYEKSGVKINDEKNTYFNESLSDLVKNVSTKERLAEYNGKLIQQINPIFQTPNPANRFDYRTAFFLPEKNLLGLTISTFTFNIIVIWAMAGLCYLALYREWLRGLVEFFGNVSIPDKVTIPFRRK
ncbi:MAG: ABC transporter G family protein [Cytophagales bacterium]|jgi:ABC-type multidrug transport system ATPase subunit|nr:ATP-binding cassette domain-containing protein [Bacteroidota bacterium]MBS1982036.1 ATP-binding cassette domain-containing protein [Bacteroidota bacterium]WHZ09493.1 MAG: ABC transporter G family protein [Cytophagales bacterium]